jgi:phospholipid/cholesterol/gamma-HCH transport system substrate-binding protein
LAAIIAAVVLVAIVLFGGASSSYTVKARFLNAGQLVRGNPVQTGGSPIGSVRGIRITDDGQAEITLKIDGDHSPLRVGTRATIRQFSQSGIANRYVDLNLPPAGARSIPDGGRIGVDRTTTAVDLDELFNTLDPRTRRSLQGFFKNQARQFAGQGPRANEGFQYLNPALSSSSRLFGELTRDTPLLERFLVDSSQLVTNVAERRRELASLVGNLNDTTRALGDQKAALAEALGRLPSFMRRSNTTFVDLRATLGDVDPLVKASKPVARRLGPFLREARVFTHDARPTIRDLSRTIRRRGRANDLIDLVRSVPALASIALEARKRTASPGGHRVSVGKVRGAFPETSDAFRGGAKEIGFARPYTTDFIGWFDDFSKTGGNYDALGADARAQFNFVEGSPGATSSGHFKRCPGSSEAPAPDGSNVYSPAQQAEFHCQESDRGVKR